MGNKSSKSEVVSNQSLEVSNIPSKVSNIPSNIPSESTEVSVPDETPFNITEAKNLYNKGDIPSIILYINNHKNEILKLINDPSSELPKILLPALLEGDIMKKLFGKRRHSKSRKSHKKRKSLKSRKSRKNRKSQRS